jgi:hypothetical protein
MSCRVLGVLREGCSVQGLVSKCDVLLLLLLQSQQQIQYSQQQWLLLEKPDRTLYF